MNVDWARDCSGNARRALQRKARCRQQAGTPPNKNEIKGLELGVLSSR